MINILRNNIRVSQVVGHSHKSRLLLSTDGKPGSYVKWGDIYKMKNDPKNFSITMSKVFTDYERCSRLNNDKFVAIVGYDENEDLDMFFLLQKPVAPPPSPNDVY
jgi:hypothetical protein